MRTTVADALEKRLTQGVEVADLLSEGLLPGNHHGRAENIGRIYYNAKSADRLRLPEPDPAKQDIEMMPGWVEREGLEISSVYVTGKHLDFFGKLTQYDKGIEPKLHELKSLTIADTSPLIYARWDTARSTGKEAVVFFSRAQGTPMKNLILVKVTQYRFSGSQGRGDFMEQTKKVSSSEHIAAGISFLQRKAKQVNRVSAVVARDLKTRMAERVPISYQARRDGPFLHRDVGVRLELAYEEEEDGDLKLKMFYADTGFAGVVRRNVKKGSPPELYSGDTSEQLDDTKNGVYFFPMYHSNLNGEDVLVVEVTPLE